MSTAPSPQRRALITRAVVGILTVVVALGVLGIVLPGVSVRSLIGREPLSAPCAEQSARVRFPLDGPADTRWAGAESLPRAQDELRAVAVNGRIYLGSGLEPKRGLPLGFASLDTFASFDPLSGRYAGIPPLPVRLDHTALETRGGHVYVFGGWTDGVPSAQAFRLVDGAWEELPSLPTPRAGAAAAAVGSKIYVIGGSTERHDAGSVDGTGTVEAFDTKRRTWERLPDMPTPRHHLAAAAVGDVVIVVGGRHGGVFSMAAVDHLDTRSRRWTTGRPLPLASGALTAVSSDGHLVVAGGGDDAGGWVTPATWMLETSGEWRRLPDLNIARHGHGMAAVGRSVFVFGGSPCAGYGITDSVERLDLESMPPAG